MPDDPKFVAKIQKYYDDMHHKLIDAENISMLANAENQRKLIIERVATISELMTDYEIIFKEYLYKAKQ